MKRHGSECKLLILALWLAASPALAQQVLHCVDTQVIGFKWDDPNGKASSRAFQEERATIKIVSDTYRIITRMQGDIAGSQFDYQCSSRAYPKGRIVCHDMTGAELWIFYRNSYTRAFLGGPPAGGSEPNIVMAYGVCTGF